MPFVAVAFPILVVEFVGMFCDDGDVLHGFVFECGDDCVPADVGETTDAVEDD